MKKVRLTIVSICLLMFCLAASAAGGRGHNPGYTLELLAGEKPVHNVGLIPKMPNLSVYGYSIFRVPAGQKARTARGERVYAFQIVHELKGETVKLEVLALLEDPDTVTEAHPMHGLRKQPAGVYGVGTGESISLSGMTEFGARPLTAKVRQEGDWF